jgi:HK97 family phage major capsid protein
MPTELKSPKLTELQGQLKDRRKKLHDIFAEAGENMDMEQVKAITGSSAEKVAQIRTFNEELEALQIEVEETTTKLRGAQYAQDFDPNNEGGSKEQETRFQGAKSVGQLFAESEARTHKQREVELDVELKTLLTTATGWAPDQVRGPRLVPFATVNPTLLDFIPTVPTNQVAVAYMEETTFTNAAAETGEGLIKPEAALAYTEKNSLVRKIAVFLPVTDEQLEDIPRISAILDNRLGFMVRQRLGTQILVGTGAGITLRGVLNVAGVQTQAASTDPVPDAVYKAMIKIMVTGQATPDLIVMNPLDWQDVRLLRTADGIYIWGSPSEDGPPRMWGLPVALEALLTQNTGVVGAFQVFSELDIKKGLVVETGYNLDDWTKNIQTIRAEMRAAFLLYRPAAFCTVTGI